VSECQVQRTLVKSPPELWETLSDPASLARHLGEFGEIRITRLQPETTVEWEADHAVGTVEITPSGWGTRVTLTATPLVGEAEAEGEPHTADGNEPLTTAIVVWSEPQPFPPARTEPAPQPDAVADSEPLAGERAQDSPAQAPASEDPDPVVPHVPPVLTPPRSWFRRLFGRAAITERPADPPAAETPAETPSPAPTELPIESEPEPEPEIQDEPLPAAEVALATLEPDVPTVEFSVPSMWEAEDVAGPEPEAVAGAEPAGAVEAAADLPAVRIDGERATAVLTSVLDDLGAAHHRPFSR
jgi:hypothetical protein